MTAVVGRQFVHPGRRLTNVLFTVNHKAGDLVFVGGFYGTLEDDVVVATDPYGTLILEGVNKFARVPSTQAMGIVMAALATEIATTLQLLPYAVAAIIAPTVGQVPGNATAGWNPVGRTTATGNATLAPIQLFNPNPYV